MQVRIITPNTRVDSWKREFLETRVRRALGRFAKQVDSVAVSFADLNGPRGGIDTQCRMRLLMRPRGEINVSAIAASISSALKGAIRRAKRGLRTPPPVRRRDIDNVNLGLPAFLLRLGW